MKRVAITPRSDWEKKVEEIGLIYHHTEGRPYWNEAAYYSFRASEIDRIELATNELHEICSQAAQHIIDHDRFKELAIPDAAIPIILLKPQIAGTNFVFCFETFDGQSYTVQQSTNIAATNWSFFTNVTGNGSLWQIIVPQPRDPQRYFRVREP